MLKWLWNKIVTHQRNMDELIQNNSKSEECVEELSSFDASQVTQYDLVVKAFFEEFSSGYSEIEQHNYDVRRRVSREIVFSQLIKSDSFSISEDKVERLRNALVSQEHVNYQELQAIFLLEDLNWELFDNCRSFCEKNNIYPYAYQFLLEKPTIPDGFENALLFVRVAQLRKLLKDKLSEKIPTKKEDVYLLFAKHFTIADMKGILEERLQEVTEQFERGVKWHKIRIFGQWFQYYSNNLFEYYIHRIVHTPEYLPKLYTPEFATRDCDDLAFIRLAEVGCFDENGNLKGIPPLFAGDYSEIDYGGFY